MKGFESGSSFERQWRSWTAMVLNGRCSTERRGQHRTVEEFWTRAWDFCSLSKNSMERAKWQRWHFFYVMYILVKKIENREWRFGWISNREWGSHRLFVVGGGCLRLRHSFEWEGRWCRSLNRDESNSKLRTAAPCSCRRDRGCFSSQNILNNITYFPSHLYLYFIFYHVNGYLIILILN